jgi:molybdopterin biosynthesis enzyme
VGGGKPLPLTQFVPAVLTPEGARPLGSQGSGDLVAMARADGWLVVPAGAGQQPAGADLAFMMR